MIDDFRAEHEGDLLVDVHGTPILKFKRSINDRQLILSARMYLVLLHNSFASAIMPYSHIRILDRTSIKNYLRSSSLSTRVAVCEFETIP